MPHRTVTRHAPGKLFAAGEYAVVEPGNPAILVAVDRQVSVTVTAAPGDGDADSAVRGATAAVPPAPSVAHAVPSASGVTEVVVVSELLSREVRLRWRRGRLAGIGSDDERRAREHLAHVVSAVEVVDRLRIGRGLPEPAAPLQVSIRSRLHENGTKFGLGSSGAVTVATVDAVAAYHGMELSPEERFRVALLAGARVDAGPSGGDLAASSWGGWILYRAPDRAAVREVARQRGVEESLRVPWTGFEVRPLPPPRGLALLVGWTGRPASTAALVADLGGRRDWRGGPAHRDFLTRSAACVGAAAQALEQSDRDGLLRQIRTARQVLAGLDEETGLGVFTPALHTLCDTAEAVGGAAKPSGAGGGDCGIALLPDDEPAGLDRLRARWQTAGITPLPLNHRRPSTEGRVQ
ncbi:phosphomevalonate kinase [Streptomyces sp. MUM 178J]|uniref:phosphomevalonate kinase n=1 Tax=Streptomyces sp. MUM 178J TaxID=2791991 RepID=UPI001F03F617|nr:phosphomevalonate kinase [Streptomyces sp. MUM 178J]WRQ83079.1 phosphomevalonate kinase [Streptomyces sp. MUM 178J]